MNILLITLYSLERNTSVAISNIGITNGLLALGHSVTWVMPSWERRETVFDDSRVRIIRVLGHDRKRDVGFILNRVRSHFDMLDFTRPFLHQLKNVQIPDEFYDVVISTSDPKTSHVFTKRLLRHVNYGKWIQHWGDPMHGDITRIFWWPTWFIKYYERHILRKADKIVYVTPFTYDAQRKAYPDLAHLFSFIPLPADMCATDTITDPNLLRIAYLGDYNPSFRNLQPLYDACASMNNVHLTIAGHGPNYPSTNNIRILPRIPQDQALSIENDSDVIFCVCNKRGTQIPGKVFYKASSDKHIMIAVEDELHDKMCQYFKSYDRFIICDNNPESIADTLESIRRRAHSYVTPERLLPVNIVREILS